MFFPTWNLGGIELTEPLINLKTPGGPGVVFGYRVSWVKVLEEAPGGGVKV